VFYKLGETFEKSCLQNPTVVIYSSNTSILFKKPTKIAKFLINLMFIVKKETSLACDFLYLRQESVISV